MNNTVDVVLVTFNPDVGGLIKCIHSIEFQVRKIWIVDNYSAECDVRVSLIDISNKIELIQLNENKGIAYAQNIGIQRSLADDSDYLLLSDQDTVYPEQFVKQMLVTFYDKQFNNIAAVAPLFHDAVGRNNNEGFVKLSQFGFSKIFPSKGIHEINQAIASGFIIKATTFNTIGLMDEDLFIDWVDIEWCWRAIAKGYLILGNADVLIEHNLGDNVTNVGHRYITIRSPIRHYYITRNAFHLAWHCSSLDFWHKLCLSYKGMRYIIGFSLFVRPRAKNMKMTLLGLYHSIIGKLGRLD